jgi:general secretion pathway protein E
MSKEQNNLSDETHDTPLDIQTDGAPHDESTGFQEPQFKEIPYPYASTHGIFLKSNDDGYTAFYKDGLLPDILCEVRRFVGEHLTLEQLPEADFQKQLSKAYQRSADEAVQAAEDMSDDLDLSRLADEINETGDLMDADDDAPVIRLINAILSQAVRENASDIHIETFENELVVRFRVDGSLYEVLKPKRMLAPLLVSRMKVMAKLDIAEKRIPQDGRISVRIAGHAIDIRMSTNPVAHGERIVLRLLDKDAGALRLSQLKMTQQTLDGYKKSLAAPHGIILVTGPTGSGKTTSLYAGLTHINEPNRNILTIEDPVEYVLAGIGQTQVNPKVGMTFAKGLRAILRQDPDVVMIGEIRDLETAEIAVQASLTGHLVISTLHTNTAIGAVTRLDDMGVEPFLLSSSLMAVMAQRLVRTLCEHCKDPMHPNEIECRLLDIPFENSENATIYRAKGCDKCNQQGYRGRLGIYEFIEIDDTLRKMIHDREPEQVMTDYAHTKALSIRNNGFKQVLQGLTTLEEVLRVTSG